jgi:hypothetical protein
MPCKAMAHSTKYFLDKIWPPPCTLFPGMLVPLRKTDNQFEIIKLVPDSARKFLVMCRARLEAVGRAEPSRAFLGRAKPGPGDGLTGLWAQPEMFESRKPWAQAVALVVNLWEEEGHHPEDGRFNSNHISEILPFSNIFTRSRRKLIGDTIVMHT